MCVCVNMSVFIKHFLFFVASSSANFLSENDKSLKSRRIQFDPALSSLQVRELQERIQKAAACTCLLPLGRDRLYRRYWLFPSASALFVEADHFGLTEDMLQPSPKPDLDTSTTKVEKGEEMAMDKAASTG